MATILPTGETTFLDDNGVPLAGGLVYFYIPGTTTPKDTFQNSGQSILNSNPVTLDSAGRGIIFGSGSYRQVVYDSVGNLIWDQETSEPNVGSVSFGGTSAGTANAQTLSAAQFSFVDGQIISFIAGITNTGTTTISIGGGSPIPILKNGTSGPVNLVANDLVAGNSYFIQYSKLSNNFQLLLSVAPAVPIGAFLNGYIFGMTLSNNGADPTNSIDFATGFAASDGTTPALMTSSSVFTKKLNAAWVVGTGNGMLDAGSVATDATYHYFMIQRSDTGNVDFLASLSPTAPTMPANYDRKRRILSLPRETGSNIIFQQNGDRVNRAPILSFSNPATFGPALIPLNIPTGVVVRPIISATLQGNGALNAQFFAQSAGITAVLYNILEIVAASGSTAGRATIEFLFSDTSGQIYFKSIITGALSSSGIVTCGWVDTRGSVS